MASFPAVFWFPCLVAAVGCARHPPDAITAPLPPTTTQPRPSPSTADSDIAFEAPAKGVSLRYPVGWASRANPEFVLDLVPRDDPAGGASISLDIPDLPFHIPGWIPFGRVEAGYLDDLKVHHPGVRVEEQTALAIPGVKASRIRTAWSAEGRAFSQIGLVMVHGDRVYILRGTGPADTFARTLEAFDAVAASLRW